MFESVSGLLAEHADLEDEAQSVVVLAERTD